MLAATKAPNPRSFPEESPALLGSLVQYGLHSISFRNQLRAADKTSSFANGFRRTLMGRVVSDYTAPGSAAPLFLAVGIQRTALILSWVYLDHEVLRTKNRTVD